MSTNVTLNGTTYSIPAEGDSGWSDLSTYFIAIASSVLQKTGGSFTLTAETDFGATYGIKSAYIKSQAANPASAGIVRLGNNESLSWRNFANNADINLKVNASDALEFNGLTLLYGSITNSMVDNAAAIAYSKLAALTASRLLVSDGSGFVSASSVTSTEAGYLSGVTSAIQTQLNAKAPSASPTFTGTVTTPLTASRAVVTGASSELAASSTTATELGYVNGVTSAIQTQLDAKVAKSTLTTKGDIYIATGASTVVRQAVGADNTFLKADSGQTNGVTWASPSGAALAVVSKTTTYTATTSDDVILVDTSGGAWTLTLYAASGNSGKILTIKKTSSDTNTLTIDANASETIDGTTTTTINSQYESLKIICDGTNWHILERKINSNWVAYTPTITGLGTPASHSFYARRVGDTMQVKFILAAGTTDASLVSFTLPNSESIDSNKIGGSTVVGKYNANATTWNGCIFKGASNSLVYFGADGTAYTSGYSGNNFANGTTFGGYFEVPISGWKGN